MILLVGLEVIRQVVDPGRQQCDLHFRRTGITFVNLAVLYNLPFGVFRNRHAFPYPMADVPPHPPGGGVTGDHKSILPSSNSYLFVSPILYRFHSELQPYFFGVSGFLKIIISGRDDW